MIANTQQNISQTITITQSAIPVLDIPDPNFKAYLVANYDQNNDNEISPFEIEKQRSLIVSSMGIASLKGIEHFTNLEGLACDNNSLTELDLSANSKLLSLDVEEATDLKTVNLGDNVNLQKLVFSSCPNYVVGDVSKFVNLVTLLVDNTATETLDVSANVKLRSLYCGGKENFTLTGLDKLSALETFYMYGSSAVEVLDFTHSPALLDVSIQGTHPNLKQVILPAGFNGEVEVPEGVEIVD